MREEVANSEPSQAPAFFPVGRAKPTLFSSVLRDNFGPAGDVDVLAEIEPGGQVTYNLTRVEDDCFPPPFHRFPCRPGRRLLLLPKAGREMNSWGRRLNPAGRPMNGSSRG